jgi:dihydrofolate reductase
MRTIKLFIASSLDGYIARSSGAVDWLFTGADYGYGEFFAGVDTVIMGRRTYEQLLSFGAYPYRGKQGFVLSRNLHGRRDENVEFVGDNLEDFLSSVKHSPGRDIWLVGGSEAIHAFIGQGWVDELILSIHPIVLGEGIPLIARDSNLETPLALQDVRTYDTGLVQVSYHLSNGNRDRR